LQALQYFTPSDQEANSASNNDFGGGGVVLDDLPAGSPVAHIAIAGGKDGNLFLVNRDSLGGFGDTRAWQQIRVGSDANDMENDTPGVIFSVPALWNHSLYIAQARGPLKAFRLDPATARLSPAGTATVPAAGFGYPGSTPSVSSQGTANGVVWILDNAQYCTPAAPGCGAAILHAYDAADVTKELWNSSKMTTDVAGYAVKFTVPTVANGKVYVGTRGNDKGGRYWARKARLGELDVYGLKPD
jgi:hypothetical protein